MARTIRRQPFTVSTSSSDYAKSSYFTHGNFSGIHTDSNSIAVDQQSMADALNVYVDDTGSLVARPTVKFAENEAHIIDRWSFGVYKFRLYKYIYHKSGNSINVLSELSETYFNNNKTSLIVVYSLRCVSHHKTGKRSAHNYEIPATLLGTNYNAFISNYQDLLPKVNCTQIEDKIFVWFAGVDLIVFNTTECHFESAKNHIYLPITSKITAGVKDKLEAENFLTPVSRTRYLYSADIDLDDAELKGRDVEVRKDDEFLYNYRFDDKKTLLYPSLYVGTGLKFQVVETSRATVILRYDDNGNMAVSFGGDSFTTIEPSFTAADSFANYTPILTDDGLHVVVLGYYYIYYCDITNGFSWTAMSYGDIDGNELSVRTTVEGEGLVTGRFRSISDFVCFGCFEYTSSSNDINKTWFWCVSAINNDGDVSISLRRFDNKSTPSQCEKYSLIGIGIHNIYEYTGFHYAYNASNNSVDLYLADYEHDDDGWYLTVWNKDISSLFTVENVIYSGSMSDAANANALYTNGTSWYAADDTTYKRVSLKIDASSMLIDKPSIDMLLTKMEYVKSIDTGILLTSKNLFICSPSKTYGEQDFNELVSPNKTAVIRIPTSSTSSSFQIYCYVVEKGNNDDLYMYRYYYTVYNGSLNYQSRISYKTIEAEDYSDPTEYRFVLGVDGTLLTNFAYLGSSVITLPVEGMPIAITSTGLYIYKDDTLWTSVPSNTLLTIDTLNNIDTYYNTMQLNGIPPDYISVLNERYFAFDNKISVTDARYEDGEYKLYLPMTNEQKVGKKITALHPLSDSIMGIFTDTEIWYITAVTLDDATVAHTKPVRSKIPAGIRDGSDVCTLLDGQAIAFATPRGIAVLAPQDFIATTEKTLSYVSENIYDRYYHFYTEMVGDYEVKIRIKSYRRWIMFYKYMSREILVLDTMNNAWWVLKMPYPITDIDVDIDLMIYMHIDYNDSTSLSLESVVYKFMDKQDVKVYEDDIVENTITGDVELLVNGDGNIVNRLPILAKKYIDWFFVSQKLHFNQINNYKAVKGMNLYMEGNKLTSAKLVATIYRDASCEKQADILEFDVDEFKTLIKRYNFPHLIRFQYSLKNNAESYPQERPIINAIGIKYEIKEGLR